MLHYAVRSTIGYIILLYNPYFYRMKKKLLGVIGIGMVLLVAFSFQPKKTPPSEAYRGVLQNEFSLLLDQLDQIEKNISDSIQLQKNYREARKHYKRIEMFLEYMMPGEMKLFINGALVPKTEPELGNKIFYPNGFQAMEEIIFCGEKIDRKNLLQYNSDLRNRINKMKISYSYLKFNESQLLEMMQYQFYRTASLNLNGYDATVNLDNILETESVFDGMILLVKCFKTYRTSQPGVKKAYSKMALYLTSAKKYLHLHPDYNTFNRLHFITEYLIPLNASVIEYHNVTATVWSNTQEALNLQSKNPFIKQGLNMWFFSIFQNDTLYEKQRAELGEKLFFDNTLSGNNKRSCATCHNPGLAFTDGLTKSMAFDEESEIPRNAPTLLNVAFQKAFFYDGKSVQLEQQAFDVVHNKTEMQGNLEEAAKKLSLDKNYADRFKAAFPNMKENALNAYSIIICISAYERSLTSLNSRFDQYLQGNKQALNEREINGYNLFGGKALCGSCHFFPLFNGTVPPYFIDTEFEVIGTPADSKNTIVDSDSGRIAITGLGIHRYSFKTPTVRNVELTSPYMHNGCYKTLEEVIDFYHRGGGNGMGFNIENQTLPFDSLQLTNTEKQDLILFMKSLTDTTSYMKN